MKTEHLYYQCQSMAHEVDFLATPEEIIRYTEALFSACMWGIKKTKENKDYFSKNHLIDKYNV